MMPTVVSMARADLRPFPASRIVAADLHIPADRRASGSDRSLTRQRRSRAEKRRILARISEMIFVDAVRYIKSSRLLPWLARGPARSAISALHSRSGHGRAALDELGKDVELSRSGAAHLDRPDCRDAVFDQLACSSHQSAANHRCDNGGSGAGRGLRVEAAFPRAFGGPSGCLPPLARVRGSGLLAR
jgi:hypothetical protein